MKLPGFRINYLLLAVLLLIILLRIPTLFEPYWYGDEGIYLALGQAMHRGAVLYRDIWDNKPPLLYILYAIHPTLLWAKITATLFVLGTCVGVYYLAKKILRGKLSTTYSLLATVLTGVFLSIPLLEGTIANAELFFTLPIVLGALLVLQIRGVGRDINKLLIFGFLMSGAFLLKVPAVFDFIGMMLFSGDLFMGDALGF